MLRFLDQRAPALDKPKLVEEAALDRYEFTWDAYLQRRESKVREEDQRNSKPGNSVEPKLQDRFRMSGDGKAHLEVVDMPTEPNTQLHALSH